MKNYVEEFLKKWVSEEEYKVTKSYKIETTLLNEVIRLTITKNYSDDKTISVAVSRLLVISIDDYETMNIKNGVDYQLTEIVQTINQKMENK